MACLPQEQSLGSTAPLGLRGYSYPKVRLSLLRLWCIYVLETRIPVCASPPGLSWLLLPNCPSHLEIEGGGAERWPGAEARELVLDSCLTSSLTLDKYFSLVISSAVYRVVVGVLEILFKVSSAMTSHFSGTWYPQKGQLPTF